MQSSNLPLVTVQHMKRVFIALLFHSAAAAFAAPPASLAKPTTTNMNEGSPAGPMPGWRTLALSHEALPVYLHGEIQKMGQGLLAVWMHRELANAEYFEKEKIYRSTRERIVVDCKSARTAVTDAVFYSEHFGKGRIAGATKGSAAEMFPVVPDSVEEQLLKAVCRPAGKVKRPQ